MDINLCGIGDTRSRVVTTQGAIRSCIHGSTQQLGDLNGDDRITSADACVALAIAAGGGSASCDAATLAAADVSGDGQVTALDALMILQAAAGAIGL
ncbi:MAG: hypothetical protein C5S48_09240 [Candidatus Methanogaster sp.]|nr:MAG: hypothetical protein C5S48_09240 [ANME-2 cluster archaeon]